MDLPPTLDGLSLDTEKRVLHVYANISKSANLVLACIQNYYLSINFTAPESDPSAIESSPPYYIEIIDGAMAGIVIIGTVKSTV